MDPVTTIAITIFSSIMGSTGLWLLLSKIFDRRSAQTRLIAGMARDRIIFLGSSYMRRGSITRDEYEDYIHYFVDPYFKIGGNGMAERVVEDVKKLPVMYRRPTTEELMTPGGNNDQRNRSDDAFSDERSNV